jgi:hypothetical protein
VDPRPPRTTSEDVRSVAFFDQVNRAFEIAERATGSVVRDYAIAGYPIRLRFAGPALMPEITPALDHLAGRADRSPALTVCLCDGVSSGAELPPSPWREVDYDPGGDVWRLIGKRFKVLFQPDVGILNMLDLERNQALWWVRDHRDLRFYEKASPLRNVLYWWMCEHDRQLVHAAAAGNSESGVLIGGKGGAGKTTTSLVCLDSGLLYAGDNYVLLSQESAPIAHSLYSSCTLHGPHLYGRFPWLVDKASNADKLESEKALVFVHQHYPESVSTGFPVKAVLFPEIAGRSATKLRAISPAQCLVLLAPSSIFNLPAAGADDFRHIARFVRRVPSYVLELGTDMSAVPDLVRGLLSSPGASN